MNTSITFRNSSGIVYSTHLSRVESSANGMTHLAAAIVIIAAVILGVAHVYFRLGEVKHSQSRKLNTVSRTEQPAMKRAWLILYLSFLSMP